MESVPTTKDLAIHLFTRLNAHDDLIAALERARDNLLLWVDKNHGAIVQIDAALAKVVK